MPWRCCGLEFDDVHETCSECGKQKRTWTIKASRTRTFKLGAKKHSSPWNEEQQAENLVAARQAAAPVCEEAVWDWIEVQLLDAEGQPFAYTRYELTLPDGTLHAATTGADGKAHIAQTPSGQCKLVFPDHVGEWRAVEAAS